MVEAMDAFLSECDDAVGMKVFERQAEVLSSEFDAQLEQFSRELLKLGLDGRPPGPPRPDGAARPLIRRGRERRTEGSERRTARGGRGRRGWALGSSW